jgi:DNA-binding NarL/FixJ family response regulator
MAPAWPGARASRRGPFGPPVVVWTAAARSDTLVPAAVAHADAIVDNTSDARELLHAVRAVARGERVRPPLTPELQSAAATGLGADYRASRLPGNLRDAAGRHADARYRRGGWS